MAHKKAIMIILCVVLANLSWLAYCGYVWSWGPFSRLHDLKTANLKGNAPQYGLNGIEASQSSPLRGKHIVFLGSSVTYGASSQGLSFADYFAARNACEITKDAVSGTTLVDNGPNSYVSRFDRLKVDAADIFVCQLSTNDATQKKPLGEITAGTEPSGFDTATVAGAIEYIISNVKERWNCPVVFYTNAKYDSEEYAAMVELLMQIVEKWEITVIDMWNDAAFNDITEENRNLYMADHIHPTKAGYREWWTPYMEEALFDVIER